MKVKHKSISEIEKEMADMRGQEIRDKLKGVRVYSQIIETENQMLFAAYLMGKKEQFEDDLKWHDNMRYGR